MQALFLLATDIACGLACTVFSDYFHIVNISSTK